MKDLDLRCAAWTRGRDDLGEAVGVQIGRGHAHAAGERWREGQEIIEQATVAAAEDAHAGLAHALAAQLQEAGLRAGCDPADATLGARIRRARERRVPYLVVMGDADIPELAQAVRTFGNATEYVPAGLIAIVVLALVGAPPMVVHVTGLTLLVGRVAHAIGLSPSHCIKVTTRFEASSIRLASARTATPSARMRRALIADSRLR